MTMNVWIRSLGGVGVGRYDDEARSVCCGRVVVVLVVASGCSVYLRCGGRMLRCRGKNSSGGGLFVVLVCWVGICLVLCWCRELTELFGSACTVFCC